MSIHENGGPEKPMQHGKPEDLRPRATRTEQWEWTASMDGHRATATSEQGAKYGALCVAYDALEACLHEVEQERDEWKKLHRDLYYGLSVANRDKIIVEKERDDLRRENARLEQLIHAINIEGARVHDRNGEFKAAVRDIIFPVAAALQTTEAKTERCRWEKTKLHHSAAWWPGCDPIEEGPSVDDWGMKYCPYCGKQIEIVSDEVENE